MYSNYKIIIIYICNICSNFPRKELILTTWLLSITLALDDSLINVITKIPGKLEEYLLEFPLHGDALTI